MKNQKGFIVPLLLAIIASLVIVGGVYVYQSNQKAKVPTDVNSDAQIQQTNSVEDTSSWKTYTNSQFGFEINYPTDWLMEDNILRGGNLDKNFCPPELKDNINGRIECKQKINNPHMPETLAPVLFFSYSIKDLPQNMTNRTIWKDVKNGYVYELYLGNSAYKNVYDQMVSTFKFINNPVFKSISKDEYEKYANLITTKEPEYQACKVENNANNLWRCEEAYKIKKYPGIVRINETCLEITLKDDNKKRICDNIADDPSVILYTFSDYIPSIGYFLKIGYWEGSAGLLINNKTGEEMKIYDKPMLSPSGNQFLSTSVGGEAGYNPDGFQVWQKSGDSYILKTKYTNRDTNDPGLAGGISNPIWVNEHSFYFMKSELVKDLETGLYNYSHQYGAYSF